MFLRIDKLPVELPQSKKVDPDKAEEKKDEGKKEEASAEHKGDEGGAEKKEGDDVPKVPPKQGGCGCRVAGDTGPGGAGALAALALGAAVVMRRRRQ